MNPRREGEAPDDQGSDDEQRQRVQKALADLRQDRLAVLEGLQVARGEVAHPIGVLEVEGIIQMKGLADSSDVLGLHHRVGGIDFRRLPGRQVNHRMGDDRDEEGENDALKQRTTEKARHQNSGTISSFFQRLK